MRSMARKSSLISRQFCTAWEEGREASQRLTEQILEPLFAEEGLSLKNWQYWSTNVANRFDVSLDIRNDIEKKQITVWLDGNGKFIDVSLYNPEYRGYVTDDQIFQTRSFREALAHAWASFGSNDEDENDEPWESDPWFDTCSPDDNFTFDF